jgi:hypothetical protein
MVIINPNSESDSSVLDGEGPEESSEIVEEDVSNFILRVLAFFGRYSWSSFMAI